MAPEALLERLAAEPERAGLFLDFDGVLAPIVARPEDACVPRQTRKELERLAALYGLVVVVSGRTTEDVRARVGVDRVHYVGTHGLELEPEANNWRGPLASFAAEAPWPAAEIELKGLAVVFHFRSVPDEDEARHELDAIAESARELGLVPRYGRKVLEILPPIVANKGTAIRHILRDFALHRGLAAGDDTTDLDSFAALDGLEVAVRVAVASPESPSALIDAADLVLGSTDEFLALLRQL